MCQNKSPCHTKIKLSEEVKENGKLRDWVRTLRMERIALYKFMGEVGVLEAWNENGDLYLETVTLEKEK